MKTIFLVVGLFLSSLTDLLAQTTATTSAGTQPGLNSAPPSSTAYAIVAKDANSRVWQRTTYEVSPSGQTVAKTHSYTELASGLNHLVNGQWVESSEHIVILPNGTAAATNGQHQAYFPGDIYNGEIELVTPDGEQIYSQPLALTYFDGTNTVTIATLTNSTGVVVGDNQVVYPNAFTGLNADLRYTYTKAGFEQDVILHQQPHTPESYGLNADTSRLQMMTEFISPTQPITQSSVLPAQAGLALTDQSLNFGTMQMASGRAFMLGQNAQNATAIVAKHWVVVQGRQILLEEVPVNAIVPALAALPLTGMNEVPHQKGLLASRGFKLPPQRVLKNNPDKHIRLAKGNVPDKGFVLDYQALNNSLTNFTFQSDTTYYVSGLVTLWGTNMIEGGTVIKYTNSSSAELSFNPGEGPMGPLICQTGPYRPAVFTSRNDNSVGEVISGSTGNPTNTLATYLYNPENNNGAGYYPPLQYLRFCYAGTAIYQGNTTELLSIRNCQFVQCSMAINDCAVEIFGNVPVQQLYNVLISRCGNGLADSPGDYDVVVDGENMTVDQTGILLAGSGTGSLSGNFTNCIFTAYGYLLYAPGESGTTTLYDCVTNTTGTGIYQKVGGASYYLVTGSTNGAAGTTNIDSTLLSDLRQETVYPPIAYTNASITTPLTLSPQAPRDTNASPSLGYHYDPLDYVYINSSLYTNLSVTAGTAIGFFDNGNYGILLHNGANFTLAGTATQPCWVTQPVTVQEGCNGGWINSYGWEQILIDGNGATPIPQLNATFTKWPVLAAGDCHFQDSWTYGVGTFSDCEFYYSAIASYRPAYYFTNCLFFREQITYWAQANAANCSMQNCTFYNGFFALCRFTGQSASFWNIQNTAFDGTAIFMQDNYSGSTNYTYFNYNAYNSGNTNWLIQNFGYSATGQLEVVRPQDVITNNYSWQSSWFGSFYLPTNSLLVNAGCTNANYIGLYHFTTQTNQTVEGNSMVDIGYHYVATDAYGNPLDSNGDGIPDYIEDVNGNGLYDTGEAGAWNVPVDDSVPSGWYSANGLSSGDPLVGIQDADWDGLLNQQEYLYGTNPQMNDGFSIWVSAPVSYSSIP